MAKARILEGGNGGVSGSGRHVRGARGKAYTKWSASAAWIVAVLVNESESKTFI